MNGVENWFVLTDIFGDDFTFENTEVECINCSSFVSDVQFDIVISKEVKNPPKKWRR